MALFVVVACSPESPEVALDEEEPEIADDDVEETDTEPAGDDTSDRPDRLVVVIPAEPPTLDLMVDASRPTRWLAEQIGERFTVFDLENEEHIPVLAESWEQVGESEWHVKIREGVQFSTGETLTAHDAAASLNYSRDGEGAYFNTNLNTITEAEALDDYTLRIETDGPDPALINRFPYIRVIPEDMLDPDILANDVVGPGPYKLEQWDRGSRILLSANEYYWQGTPEWDEVEFLIREEASVRVDALLAGEAHVAIDIPPVQASRAPQHITTAGQDVAGFILNTVGQTDGGSIMEDRRVRLAVNHAVDRQAIIDSIFAGAASLPQGHFNRPGIAGTDTDQTDYEYDPELAQELLEEAGASGEAVRIRLTTERWPFAQEMTETVAAYLSAVGLQPEIVTTDFATWVDQYRGNAAGDDAPFELKVWSHSNHFMDSTMGTFASLRSRDAGGGFMLIADETLDELIEAAVRESDPEERYSLARQAWNRFREEAYALPIAAPQDSHAAVAGIAWEGRDDNLLLVDEIGWQGQ